VLAHSFRASWRVTFQVVELAAHACVKKYGSAVHSILQMTNSLVMLYTCPFCGYQMCEHGTK